MSVLVHISHAIRAESGSAPEFEVAGATVREALQHLADQYPAVYRCVCDETGQLRRHIHLFVNDSLLHGQDGLDTAFEPGDVLSLMTAVSGG